MGPEGEDLDGSRWRKQLEEQLGQAAERWVAAKRAQQAAAVRTETVRAEVLYATKTTPTDEEVGQVLSADDAEFDADLAVEVADRHWRMLMTIAANVQTAQAVRSLCIEVRHLDRTLVQILGQLKVLR